MSIRAKQSASTLSTLPHTTKLQGFSAVFLKPVELAFSQVWGPLGDGVGDGEGVGSGIGGGGAGAGVGVGDDCDIFKLIKLASG